MRSRFSSALAAAVAIHVAILGTAALHARWMPPVQRVSGSGWGPWLDLTLVEPPADQEPPEQPEVSGPSASPEKGEPRVAMRVPRSGPVAPNPGQPGTEGEGLGAVLDPEGSEPEGIPGGNGESGSGAGAGGTDGRGTGGRSIDLGLDRGRTWMWTRPERPAPRPRPASTTGGLQEALDAHDRKVGLGYGGPVISAFHSVAASPNAPQTGNARFEAIIDGSGRVTSVRVLSVNGDMASWQAVAQRVLQTLRARVLRVPLGGRGLAIVVDVRSRYQLPSGAAPGKGVEIKGAGVAFDVSDIGARPAHNVAVSVVTERRL